MEKVRAKEGVPVADDFNDKTGTPIVVDESTGKGYVQKLDGTIVELSHLDSQSGVPVVGDFTEGQIVIVDEDTGKAYSLREDGVVVELSHLEQTSGVPTASSFGAGEILIVDSATGNIYALISGVVLQVGGVAVAQVITPYVVVVDADATVDWPDNCDFATVTLCGGGGGGGGSHTSAASANYGGGGGAGETVLNAPLARGSNTDETVVIGAAGAGGAAGSPGDPGGATTVRNYSAAGGLGGATATSGLGNSGAGGAGGESGVTGGAAPAAATNANPGTIVRNKYGGNSGAGGAGGDSVSSLSGISGEICANTRSGPGGNSYLGKGGASVATDTDGSTPAASEYGAGGSGAGSFTTASKIGGSGVKGVVIFTFYINAV